jgi:hypothetical protein
MRRTVFASCTKFWPYALRGRKSSSLARCRISVRPRSRIVRTPPPLFHYIPARRPNLDAPELPQQLRSVLLSSPDLLAEHTSNHRFVPTYFDQIARHHKNRYRCLSPNCRRPHIERARPRWSHSTRLAPRYQALRPLGVLRRGPVQARHSLLAICLSPPHLQSRRQTSRFACREYRDLRLPADSYSSSGPARLCSPAGAALVG